MTVDYLPTRNEFYRIDLEEAARTPTGKPVPDAAVVRLADMPDNLCTGMTQEYGLVSMGGALTYDPECKVIVGVSMNGVWAYDPADDILDEVDIGVGTLYNRCHNPFHLKGE